ncbi:MAG: polyribonucleotide nucleotidyltransferase [Candidatus Roizmanbacteria bacterium]|nr:MAG: polyribonucleotide nucleotidyltransferase [Candidatus Roizmanbacteria bacterium]
MKIIEESIEISGQKLTLQFGKLAQSATSSVFARLGDTSVLVTVTAGKNRTDIDYFPLQVEYAEKLYAGGRIKGSRWVKREGRPSDDAVLKGRLIDRSIRPLFPKTYKREVQIIITLLSVDGVNSPDILAAIAVSSALHVSPIPWDGPISTVRVGYVKGEEGKGEFMVNPSEEDERYSALDLVVSSTREDKIIMIETGAEELGEDVLLEGMKMAKRENSKIIKFIEGLREKIGVEKEVAPASDMDEKLVNILKKDFKKQIDELIKQTAAKEFEDKGAVDAVVSQVYEFTKEEYDKKTIASVLDAVTKKTIRERILETRKRVDGRKEDEVRPISVEVGVLPRIHGSAIFQRGDTQVLSIATLGAPNLEQLIESPGGIASERYIHHYYMPPYSVGEAGRIGFVSRREIGHGALAEKAVQPVLPTQKEFPYTIRVVSEVLASNGSTSMASTCASILSLMDAGVPIKTPIAGIAMGLLSKSDDDYMILTDIMGIEDFSGEMDFKVTGSTIGITAIQLDVKNKGLTDKMIEEILERAKNARLFILGKMNAILSKPRKDVSEFAPRVVVLYPPADKIGEIIGPGGRNIRALIAKTETEINVDDDGKVTITGLDKDKVQMAKESIENITREVKPGETFEGEVKRILPFGAFVEFLPGKEGMVHVSKMGKGFVKSPEEVVKIGQKVKVEVIQIDAQGRINLRLLN